MLLLIITDTQLVLSIAHEYCHEPVYQTCLFDSHQVISLSIFNTTWLHQQINQFAQTHNKQQAPIIIALASSSLQEYWQHEAPSGNTPEHNYCLQQQQLFDKLYYALLRYDQIVQYQLVCLPDHKLVCLTTITIAWYYAYRKHSPTKPLEAHTLAQLQQALCAQEYTSCSLVYACTGLAHIAQLYAQKRENIP